MSKDELKPILWNSYVKLAKTDLLKTVIKDGSVYIQYCNGAIRDRYEEEKEFLHTLYKLNLLEIKND